MRILITEEALRLGNGHWPRYVQDLAEGFRAAGDHVDVLAHKDATRKVFDAVPGAVPWFARDCRADTRSQGLLGGIRHNFSFYRDLARWLDSHEPYDWVLSLSSRPKHLLAFALLARKPHLTRTRYLVLFVLGFGKVAGHRPVGGNAEFRPSAANLFAKLCFLLLRGAVQRGQVVLAAETKGMKGELERFSGLPASLYPHPVEMLPPKAEHGEDGGKVDEGSQSSVGSGQRSEAVGERKGGQEEVERWLRQGGKVDASVQSSVGSGQASVSVGPKPQADLADSAGSGGKLVRVIAPGFARHEKGSDLLQRALKVVDTAGRNVKFVLQWQEDFPMPDGTMVRPDPELRARGDVEYLGEILVGGEYLEFLRSGDLVVLPYRSHSYSRRVSRVSVEASLLGKPIIYTRDTWSSEVAEMAGCGVEIGEETPEAIATAIGAALSDLENLQKRAAAGARAVKDYYSVAQFRALLLNKTGHTA